MTDAQISAAEARKVLKAEQTAQIDACRKEMDELLKRHKCAIDVAMMVTQRGAQPIIRVVPQPLGADDMEGDAG